MKNRTRNINSIRFQKFIMLKAEFYAKQEKLEYLDMNNKKTMNWVMSQEFDKYGNEKMCNNK